MHQRTWGVVIVLVAALGCAVWVAGQSVAQIARKPDKDNPAAKPARIITDRDVKHAPREVFPFPVKDRTSETEREKFYYQQYIAQFSEIEKRDLDCQEAKLDYDDTVYIYNGCLNQQGLLQSAGLIGDGSTVDLAYQKMIRARSRLGAAESELDKAKQELEDLQEAARQEGVPPGVFREAEKDWQERVDNRDRNMPS